MEEYYMKHLETSKMSDTTAVTDANNNTSRYEFSQTGKLAKEIDPLGNIICYSYDINGHLASRTDAIGNTITYSYNVNGRLLGKRYPDGTEETFTYDSKGNIISAANMNISYAFTCDATGRMLSSTDSNGKTIQYKFDTAGNKSSATYPDGSIIGYTHDKSGNCLTKTELEKITTYTYDNTWQLMKAETSNTCRQPPEEYSYDVVGNRLTGPEPHSAIHMEPATNSSQESDPYTGTIKTATFQEKSSNISKTANRRGATATTLKTD